VSEPSDGHSSYWTLVDVNAAAIRDFLQWSAACEASTDTSLRWRARGDLREAREVIPLFEDPWWAVVVYTCFNSTIGTQAVSDRFRRPLPVGEAQVAAASITLPAGSVGMHRIQPGHAGARRALVAACGQADTFRTILYCGIGFDDRYASLRSIGAASWGRTTCYDLLLRAGALGVANGLQYEPEFAYLAESTGPAQGFIELWGHAFDSEMRESEDLLGWWTANWDEVAQRVGAVDHPLPAYGPADFENALCLYQEHSRRNARLRSD
jgi:hypothetical protein